MHIGEATLNKDKTGATSDSSSIGTYISDFTKSVVEPTKCIQDILAAYLIDDPIWDCANPCDILIDTVTDQEYSHLTDHEYHNRQRDQRYILLQIKR